MVGATSVVMCIHVCAVWACVYIVLVSLVAALVLCDYAYPGCRYEYLLTMRGGASIINKYVLLNIIMLLHTGKPPAATAVCPSVSIVCLCPQASGRSAPR